MRHRRLLLVVSFGVALMASDDDVAFALDYLGQPQPLAPKRLSLTSGGGGGAPVTAPITPSVGARTGITTGGGGAASSSSAGGAPSSALALRALDFARRLTGFGSAAPTDAPVLDPAKFSLTGGEGGAVLDPAKFSLTRGEGGAVLDPAKFSLGGTPLNTSLPTAPVDTGRAATEAALESQSGGTGAVGSTTSVGDTGSGVGAVGAVAGAGLSAYNASQQKNDLLKAAAAADAGLYAASLVYPPAALIALGDQLLQTILIKAGAFSPGSYPRRRQFAGTLATGGLGSLGSAYARSNDPASALRALQDGAANGHIRGLLNVPPDLAERIGLPPGSHEFSSFTPESFTRVLDHIAANPSDLDRIVTGSGDVPYLPQRQAQQVADVARQDTIQFLRHLAQQRQAASAPPPPPSTARTPMPMSQRPMTSTGPESALGFARDVIEG